MSTLNRKQVITVSNNEVKKTLTDINRTNNFPNISYMITNGDSANKLLKNKKMIGNKETAYLCKKYIWNLPTNTPRKTIEHINN